MAVSVEIGDPRNLGETKLPVQPVISDMCVSISCRSNFGFIGFMDATNGLRYGLSGWIEI